MNILIMNWRDLKHPRAGGAEIVTFEHAKRLVTYGHTVTWLTSWFQGVPREETVDGVHIVRRGGSVTVYVVVPFYYIFHAREFDIIVDEIHGLPFFTPLYSRKPKVAFIHEIAKEIWEYMAPFPLTIIGRILEPIYFFLYRNIPFWTDAPSTVDELVEQGIARTHCVAIPCPVSNPIVASIPKKRKDPTFLYVSRLVKMKGIEDILDAFSFIVQKLPAATLWVAGEGYPVYVAQLKARVGEMGLGRSVTFFGKVNERKKLQLMRDAHILLHASIREGWGLVVLEAASQGTPAVVYNVQGLRDVVRQGKTGVLVRHNTAGDLAKEAVALYRDNRRYQKLQHEALRWVRSLRWDDVAGQSMALLKRVLDAKQ